MKRYAVAVVIGAFVAVTAACSADPIPSPAPSIDDGVPGFTASASPEPSATPAPPLVIGGSATASVVESTDVVTGLRVPWDLAFMPDGSMLITQRDSGVIIRFHNGAVSTLTGPGADAIKARLDPVSEAGLLGIALHPDDPTLLYAYTTRDDGNAVIRMDLSGDTLGAPVDVVAGIPKASTHDGGRIAFGPDGYLYITTGDAQNRPSAQDLNSLSGKILRVVADGGPNDGAPAPGNPFDNRVWTYGHRNVQGLGWVADGRMYASEFGQSDMDELNLIVPGANYGWPAVEARIGAPPGTELGSTVNGITYPVAEWSNAVASPSGIAITDEAIYMAALRGQAVWRIPLTAEGIGTPHVVVNGLGRVRHVELGPDGALYLTTSNRDRVGNPRAGDDRVIRIVVEQD